MRWRQVVLLYGVLALLAAEYWLVERRPGPPRSARPPRERFLTVRPDEVREVRLRRGDRTVVSRRADGRWTVVEPADAPIPPDLIAAFTEALTEAEAIDLVGATQSDARSYGLDEHAARIDIVTDGGPVTVMLGGTNPTGTAVYARRGTAPEVVLIGRNVSYYEDLIFQALPAARAPASGEGGPVGG
jgi:hypothetical protein